jgi:hypothetical protein
VKEEMLKQFSKRLCPFLPEPFEECYCVKMNSQEIEKAVYLCAKDFEACEIYKNHNNLSISKNLRLNLEK